MAEGNQKQNKPDLEQIARNDYKLKRALRQKELEYYPQKLQEFGLKTIERFVKYHPNPSKYMKLGITFGHRDLEVINCYGCNKTVLIYTFQ